MSSPLQEKFDKAAEMASSEEGGKWPLSNADKQTMYGCFKAVRVGPVEGERPGMFSPTARSKWDGWKEASDLTKEEAMQKYIDIVAKFYKFE